MNDRQTVPWLSSARAMLLNLAYCAQHAEHELTASTPVPTLHQLGMTGEPRVIRLARSLAVLIGEMESRLVITMAAGPPLAPLGLKAAAQSILQGNADGLEAADGASTGQVSRRYQSLARWMWSAVETCLPPAVDEIILTGHGVGGAAATLAALSVRDRLPHCRVGVVTFGSPPVGDADFRSEYDRVIPWHTRVECDDDVIPHLGIDPLLLSLMWPEEAARLRAAHRSLAHVGRLQYLQDGCEVDDIVEKDLSRARRFRLFSLLCSASRDQAIRDHALSDCYIPALSMALRSSQRGDAGRASAGPHFRIV